MNYYYDLHIHSLLSPCADVLMTPNNILNMAALKGLDIIAVTDHNSLKQQTVIAEIAKSYAFLLVYGVEVHVREGLHMLVYFKTLKDALRFDGELETKIDKNLPFDPKEGMARLTDLEDFVIEELPYSTTRPLDLSLSELFRWLEKYDHLCFIAHIDRPGNGVLSHVRDASANGVELSPFAPADFLSKNGLEGLRVLHNSDAHQLMDISEKHSDNQIDLKRLDIDLLFKALRS